MTNVKLFTLLTFTFVLFLFCFVCLFVADFTAGQAQRGQCIFCLVFKKHLHLYYELYGTETVMRSKRIAGFAHMTV